MSNLCYLGKNSIALVFNIVKTFPRIYLSIELGVIDTLPLGHLPVISSAKTVAFTPNILHGRNA